MIFRLSPEAKSDIDTIWDYAASKNLETSQKLLDALRDTFLLLARHANMGKQRQEFAPTLRSFPCRRYVIFYVPHDYGIEVWRIVHSSRDMEVMLSS